MKNFLAVLGIKIMLFLSGISLNAADMKTTIQAVDEKARLTAALKTQRRF